jgi:hypothetical protein
MKNILFLSVLLFAFACKKPETITTVNEPTKIITASFWKLDRYTDTNSNTLNQNQLNSQAQGIFGLEFEFLADNRVRGRILNAGTWYLVDNDATMNIDIIGFAGNFKVVSLSKTKMILQAENNKLINAATTVNLELIPVL